jgi:Single-strand binding protein family
VEAACFDPGASIHQLEGKPMAKTERQPEATSTPSDTLEYRPSVRPERSNRIAMTGRLTSDPVLRQTKSGVAVAHLRLATNDGKRSDFFDV